MAIKVVPKYPVVAKNVSWQKQKSFRDKLKKATKTGLGTQLEAAEKAFAKIDCNKLDVNRRQKAGASGCRATLASTAPSRPRRST